MFRPIEFYMKEQKSPVEAEAVKLEWTKLDSRDLLRYIKQAESAYDKYVEENDGKIANIHPFSYFLQKQEAKILFESYGLPEKLPANSRVYFLQKHKKEALDLKTTSANEELILEDVKKEAEEKWSKASQEERNKIQIEFQNLNIDYNEKYFYFARNLPKQRVFDYINYLNPGPKNIKSTPSKSNESQASKDLRLKFSPFEAYFEKYQEDFLSKYPSLFVAKSKAKAIYTGLSDKKKVKFIKKAEEKFDQYSFTDNQEIKPLFSSLLTKADLKLLLDSYGMPEQIGSNVTGYYFKIHCNDFKENHMKNIMQLWSSLSEDEKAKVVLEHSEKYNSYKKRNQKFLEELPLARVPDYNYYIEHTAKKPKSKTLKSKTAKENSTSTVNKSVELVDTASGLSDIEEIDLDNTHNGVDNHTDSKLVDKFLNENSRQPENAFSLYFNEELETSKPSEDLDENESVQLLNKIARKWYKLDQEEKEKYNEKVKSTKKNVKKTIKNFVKENPSLNLDSDVLKSKLNEYSNKNTRKINFNFEDESSDVLYLYNRDLDDLIDSDVEEVQVKKEKKKNKTTQNGDADSPAKKIRVEMVSTPQKKK